MQNCKIIDYCATRVCNDAAGLADVRWIRDIETTEKGVVHHQGRFHIAGFWLVNLYFLWFWQIWGGFGFLCGNFGP